MFSDRLPPLNALRAFEAAARHLSIKDAADELAVTPGAVSQMIKGLELRLGVRLFNRSHRSIALTEAGRDYLPTIRNAFRQISEATRRLAAVAESGALTVSATPSFAAAWLAPRLRSFQDAHPAIDLQVTTGKALATFDRDGVDVAIRHGLGRYPGLRSDRLFAVELVPVAAPALIERLGLPKLPSDLAAWPHIHDAERKDWHLWLQAQGVAEIERPRGPAFDDPSLVLTAAVAGQGAALLPAAMTTLELAKGRLVKLFDIVWPEAFAYYLVYPATSEQRPKVAAFREWLLSAASEDAHANASPATRESDP